MLNTEAAVVYFGSTLDDNQSFIEHIYINTLGKTYAEDPDGVDYWVNELTLILQPPSDTNLNGAPFSTGEL